MLDYIFGNLFDFNGDGKTDLSEEVLGFTILNELTEDETNNGDD